VCDVGGRVSFKADEVETLTVAECRAQAWKNLISRSAGQRRNALAVLLDPNGGPLGTYTV